MRPREVGNLPKVTQLVNDRTRTGAQRHLTPVFKLWTPLWHWVPGPWLPSDLWLCCLHDLLILLCLLLSWPFTVESSASLCASSDFPTSYWPLFLPQDLRQRPQSLFSSGHHISGDGTDRRAGRREGADDKAFPVGSGQCHASWPLVNAWWGVGCRERRWGAEPRAHRAWRCGECAGKSRRKEGRVANWRGVRGGNQTSGMWSRSGRLPGKYLAHFDFQFSLFISSINVYFTFVILKVFRNMGKNDFVLVFDT